MEGENKKMKISIFRLALFTCLVCLFFSATSAQIRGWGYNNEGQLGIGNFMSSHPNPQIVSSLPDATAADSTQHTIFLKGNGTVAITGYNSRGQAGNGTSGTAHSLPVSIPNLTDVRAVSVAGLHTLTLKTDGSVWASGRYDWLLSGGYEPRRESLMPVQIGVKIFEFKNIVAINAGDYHSLALKADGTVWAWGANDNGQLGIGDRLITGNIVPVQVPGLSNVIAVQASGFTSFALKSDGTVWAWGDNLYGLLGNGTTGEDARTPVQVPGLTGVSQISAGGGTGAAGGETGSHVVALKPDGTVFVWGNNGAGQIGNGTTGGAPMCACVPTPSQTSISEVIDIKAGAGHTLVRKRDGSVWAWGSNVVGQAGNGTPSAAQSLPVQSNVGTGNVWIAAGLYYSHAGIPSIATFTGSNVRLYGENVNITFADVTASGTTHYSAIDPNTFAPPAGFDIVDNSPAYNLTTSAFFTSANVCLKVTTEYSPTRFDALRLLHQENGVFVDRTVSRDYRRREVCAGVTSFSPFVLALPVASAFDSEGGKDD